MDLKDYFRILRRSWVTILIATIVGVLLAGVLSAISKPVYTSETQLFVSLQSSGSISDLQQGNTFSQARVLSYVKAATTPAVLQPAIDSLGLNETPAELARSVKVSNDANTVLINISVQDSSAVESAAKAKSIASSLIAAVDNLEKPSSGGSSPVKLSIVTPAVAPSEPSAPNIRLYLLLGLLLGLVLGLAVAFLRATFDNRIRGEADLKNVTSAPVLGGIAYDSLAVRSPLLTDAPQQGLRAESYRTLRTNLQFANVSGRAKTVMITSSLPGEGKSTTAMNLAIALAQGGQRICLVDADLRRPMIAKYLGLEGDAGLTTVLVGHAHAKEVLQPWGEYDLSVLTSGQLPPNPSELLGSAAMKDLVRTLEEDFDTVIVDAPPLLPVTDAAVLSQLVGGTILVVGAQQTRRPELERALSALEIVDASLFGIVMNRLPARGPDSYTYSYSGYAADVSKSPKSYSDIESLRTDPGRLSNRSALPQKRNSPFAEGSSISEPITEVHPAPKRFPRAVIDGIEINR